MTVRVAEKFLIKSSSLVTSLLKMSLLVVSDLHITDAHDPLYASLLALIGERAQTGDTLVLAGDLFDFLVGNKSIFLNRYSKFFELIRSAASRGVKIHYIEGNHDFLIRKAFRGIEGVTVHSDEFSIELGQKRFFFAHGDLVDQTDYGYRIWRGFTRSPIMKAFVRALPGPWIDWVGVTLSKKSRGRKPLLPSGMPADRVEILRKIYRSYAAEQLSRGFDFVVMGHCHDLDEMSFSIGGRPGQYVNVGYPRVHGSFLSWTSGDSRIRREKMPESTSEV